MFDVQRSPHPGQRRSRRGRLTPCVIFWGGPARNAEPGNVRFRKVKSLAGFASLIPIEAVRNHFKLELFAGRVATAEVEKVAQNGEIWH